MRLKMIFISFIFMFSVKILAQGKIDVDEMYPPIVVKDTSTVIDTIISNGFFKIESIYIEKTEVFINIFNDQKHLTIISNVDNKNCIGKALKVDSTYYFNRLEEYKRRCLTMGIIEEKPVHLKYSPCFTEQVCGVKLVSDSDR